MCKCKPILIEELILTPDICLVNGKYELTISEVNLLLDVACATGKNNFEFIEKYLNIRFGAC